MADSTLNRIKDEVAKNPATDRLKEELQAYLQARAQKAVTDLGSKLGQSVTKLADPRQGLPGAGLAGSLAKGGQALSEGKSPAQAAMAVGSSHVKDMLKNKVKGMFGKGRKSGGGKSKSVTIVEDIDVGVPVREAYDQWTQFQEFSTFAKGVVSVEKADDVSSNWKVKVAKSTRSWKANVTEQIPDERITWTTEGAKGTVKGVVTFHRITDDLTRVLLVLEYFPKGLFEKTGNIWRAQGRRARLDLKLYRKFIMMRGEATDGWRGEIRDGEVVLDHDEAVEAEESEGSEGSEAEGSEEGGDAGEAAAEEPSEDDGEEPEDLEEDAEYEDEADADSDADSEYEDEEDAEADADSEYEDDDEVEAEEEPEAEYDDFEADDEDSDMEENEESRAAAARR
ncbi:Polyketide cyclase / dehydrase and lipid transport [Streptomyces sp. WMMB 714]|uniref:SRPBCC family protein n=1 Tax=Streptomyces sp. WMMB 714 TaxID=1286822 RepID=UPI0005F8347B|nr:SRPBCC family protein [Streptomyces sp. WMMB 714]SCK53357.1 Polyketide cyclase / dehydrase and lipid transport [Streptomyces sp. WMMB 714]